MTKLTARQMLAEANANIETLSVEQARARAEAEGAVFVDVRDGTERQRDGAVPGAVHASRGLLEFKLDPESPMHEPAFSAGKPIIFYCASGGRSALAADLARRMGYDKVSHMAGGFGAWRNAQLPVEKAG